MASHSAAYRSDIAGKISTIRLRPHNFLRKEKSGEILAIKQSTSIGKAVLVERNDDHRDEKAVELLPLLRRIARKMHALLPAHVEVDDLVAPALWAA